MRGVLVAVLFFPPHAQLFAPDLGGDFFHRVFGKLAQMERAELDADEARDLQAQKFHQPLHFAVLAFLQRHARPGIHALGAFEVGDHGTVIHAVHRHAHGEALEIGLGDLAEQPHAIFARPAGGGQLQHARHRAVIGEEQQAFRIEIEPPDRDHARQILRQRLKDSRPTFGVLVRGDEADRLVIAPQPRGLGLHQRLAVHRDHMVLAHADGRRGDLLAIERHAALRDQLLGIAARADSGARDDLGDAFAGGSVSVNCCSSVSWRLRGTVLRQHWQAAMTDDETMALALAEAESAAARGEVPVGAVLAGADGRMLARDGNRIVERHDPTAHAEMLVLRAGAAALGNERLIGHNAVCDAGALRDVRGSREPRTRDPDRIRRRRSEGRSGAARPALLRAADLSSSADHRARRRGRCGVAPVEKLLSGKALIAPRPDSSTVDEASERNLAAQLLFGHYLGSRLS